MNARLRRRATATATAGALAVAMVVGSSTIASAQIGGNIDTSSLGLEEVELIGSAAGSLPLGSTLGSLGSAGSTNIPLGGTGSYVELPNPPRPRDESINAVELRAITQHGEYEHWLVTSAAMQREIVLEVVPSRVTDEGPAPVLYLLDGVELVVAAKVAKCHHHAAGAASEIGGLLVVGNGRNRLVDAAQPLFESKRIGTVGIVV